MACSLFRRLLRRRWRGSVTSTTSAQLPQQASTTDAASFCPTSDKDALDSLYLLNTMAQQGSPWLIVNGFPNHFDTNLVTLKYSSQPGYLETREVRRTGLTVEILISFATASEAAMALASCPSVTIDTQTFVPIVARLRSESELADRDTASRKKLKTTHESIDNRPTCKICTEKLSVEFSKPCLECKGVWCYGCLETWFKTALDDQEMFPAKCCGRVMHYDTVRGIMTTPDYNKYKLRYEEFSTPKPVYCGNSKCSTFLSPRSVQPDINKKVSCLACGTKTCTECRNVVDSATDHSCPNTDATDKLLKRFSYKRCPRCDGGVAHMYGCPHVRCQCGAHWCWDCQRPIQICWRSPCERSRLDGNVTEDDVDPEPESDGNTESGDATDNANIQNDNSQATHQSEQPSEQAVASTITTETVAAEQLNASPDIATSGPTTISAELASSETTTPIVDNQVPVTIAEPVIDNNEELINLDASDFEDWEGGDFDFGEEPQDEAWDTWGCIHRLQGLSLNKMPPLWLADDTNVADCLRCFEPTAFSTANKPAKAHKKDTDDAVLRGRTRTVPWHADQRKQDSETIENERPNSTASTLVPVTPLPETTCATVAPADTPTDAVPQSNATPVNPYAPASYEAYAATLKEKPQLYNCTKCGVVYCFKCKKAATKAINAQLKKKEVTRN